MARQLFAEFIGTAFLLIGVVGSGIMGEALADGNIAIALLANAIATGCILYVLITTLGPISGAHFNPVVTAYFALTAGFSRRQVPLFWIAQISGGTLGVWLTHLMFDLDIFQLSTTDRTGINQWSSEIIATFGLLFVIIGGLKSRPETVPTLVALYITGAYWFTSSTSFANPAVTIARGLSDTFAGINPAHVAGFVLAQIIGMGMAILILPRLFKD
ncbi:aquaporin [Algirhabdus cladophorae]|uniref:aquaporin n=1 Tax=Algirhabdus cladophorae TaxID=3377108 RepID=UPI003B84748B